jgi:hypothetical protein
MTPEKGNFTFIEEKGNLEIKLITKFKTPYRKLEIHAIKLDSLIPKKEKVICINPVGTRIDI